MISYLNPVYPYSCPDPFVLKYCGEYWGYCTGRTADGRCFGVVHSRDLVNWRAVGGALEPLSEAWHHYWAPEVTYHNGRFYMYYSVGDELTLMQIRVATATHPAGPFVDSGHRLTSEAFAIDAHVFIADDGVWHLFYATDFLEHSHIGTGTVRARLRDPFTLAEAPRPVTLPRYDWHVYDPQRAEKGGVRWHTVEGPFVLEHKGRYYQMFSGGNWQNLSYGISYALSDRPDPAHEWAQVADGERVLPIVRTIPGKVIGPGHNSVVRGPDNRQPFCVYHRWSEDSSARVMAIDPLDWAGERLLVLGPSTTPRPAPLPPAVAGFFDAAGDAARNPQWAWDGGSWTAEDSVASQRAVAGAASARCLVGGPSFVAELSVRALEEAGAEDRERKQQAQTVPIGGYGVSVGDELWVMLEPARRVLAARLQDDDGNWAEEYLALPPDFDPYAYHLLRVELDGRRVRMTLDGGALRWNGQRRSDGDTWVALRTLNQAAAFAGFALTLGWEQLFMPPDDDLAALGWSSEHEGWQIEDGQLWHRAMQDHAAIVKGPPLDTYELVVNARLITPDVPGACYGFCLAGGTSAEAFLLRVERAATGWMLTWRGASGVGAFELPATFDPTHYQQFRLRRDRSTLAIAWENLPLGIIPLPAPPAPISLYVHQAIAAFDMVRLTAFL